MPALLAVAAGKLAAVPREGTGRGPATCFPLPGAAFFSFVLPRSQQWPWEHPWVLWELDTTSQGGSANLHGAAIPMVSSHPTSQGMSPCPCDTGDILGKIPMSSHPCETWDIPEQDPMDILGQVPMSP